MKKIIFLVLLALLIFYSLTLFENQAQAKKKIIRRSSLVSSLVGNKPVISPKLRRDRRTLIINFSNLGQASSLHYELSYTAEGIPQGVVGTLNPSGQTNTQRELLFGTCSKNVCRYHRSIKEMRLTVTSTLASGTKIRKTFRIRP